MKIIIKIALLITVSTLVIACATTQDKTEADKKIATAKINTQLGMAYLERHDLPRAKQKLLLALSQAPEIPEVWYSMAYYLESTGEKTEAKQYYLKSVKLAPNRGDVQNNYGTFLCRSGQYHAAITHFLLAAKDINYLDTAASYENAGLCALKIPNKSLAKKYFTQATLEDPERRLSYTELAKLQEKKLSDQSVEA